MSCVARNSCTHNWLTGKISHLIWYIPCLSLMSFWSLFVSKWVIVISCPSYAIPVKNLSSQLTHSKLTWNLMASSFWSRSTTSQRTHEMISQLWPSCESSVSLHLTPWVCCDLFVRSTDELSMKCSSVLTVRLTDHSDHTATIAWWDAYYQRTHKMVTAVRSSHECAVR